jgi:hypothetical protein
VGWSGGEHVGTGVVVAGMAVEQLLGVSRLEEEAQE